MIEIKELLQVFLYSVQMYGGLLTNIADKLIENWIFKRLEGKLVADCFRHENDDNRTPPTHKEDIKVGRPFKLLNLFVVKTVNHND